MTRLVDLSQDIYEGMQVYPGHLKTVTFQHATHRETAAPRAPDEFAGRFRLARVPMRSYIRSSLRQSDGDGRAEAGRRPCDQRNFVVKLE